MGQLTAIGARRWADAGALVLIVGLTVIATLIGLRTGFSRLDVDEAVYRRTLLEMQSGKGYYAATRDALVAKEGKRELNGSICIPAWTRDRLLHRIHLASPAD